MFTLEDFNSLNNKDKVAYVRGHGLFMNERTEGNYNIHSHQVHSFYVEIWHDHIQGCLWDKIISFSSTEFALKEISALSMDKQVEIAWTHGQQIDSRMEIGFPILLFQLPAIYIEVWYMPDSHQVHSVKAFGLTDQLEPYLDNIDISILEDTPDN